MISKQTAEHFTWREFCDGWYLLNQPTRLTVLQECMPPGTSEVRHYHREAYQFFFILSGVATLEINGKPEILHPHEGAEVPFKYRFFGTVKPQFAPVRERGVSVPVCVPADAGRTQKATSWEP